MISVQWKRIVLSGGSILLIGAHIASPVWAQASNESAGNQDASALNDNSSDAQLHLRHSYQKCLSASGGITVSMINCSSKEYRFQDKRLKRIYKSLMSKLDAEDKIQARDQERVWLKSRDRHCNIHDTGGTADDIATHGCYVVQTAIRATQLEDRIDKGY